MSRSSEAVKSILIIIIFAFASKLLGFIREMLIAAEFGSGIETDTYFIAQTAVALLTIMLTQAINVTTIPVLSEVEVREGKSGKMNHTNNLLNIALIISVLLVLLGWVLSPFIMKLLANGFEGEQFRLAVLLMRIGLPSIVFAGIVGVFRGYLQSEHKFLESAAAQFPFNFVYIFYLLFLADKFGIKGMMLASVFAVGAQILIQISGIRNLGYKYKLRFDIKDAYVKKINKLIPPVLLSVVINNINEIVSKSIASGLAEGSISALNYSNRLKELVMGIFVTAVATVIFPVLSQEASKDNYDELKRIMRQGINCILLITIPAMVGMIILARPIVRIAFERGAFDVNDTYMTSGALVFYSFGLAGMALRTFLNRVFYSLQDTKTPMTNGIIAIVFNIILSLIFIQFMDHRGLALANSVTAIFTTVLLIFSLKEKIGTLGTRIMLRCGFKSLFAAFIMGISVYFLYHTLEQIIFGSNFKDLLVLLISSSAGALIYFIIIYILKVEEIDWFIHLVKKKIKGK